MNGCLAIASKLRFPPISLTLAVVAFSGWILSGPASGATQSGERTTVATVEISPSEVQGKVGEEIVFRALARDGAGAPLDLEPTIWFAAPWDLGAIQDGTLILHRAGKVQVGAVIQGRTGYATVYVKPAPVASIEIAPLDGPVVAGGQAKLTAIARRPPGSP